VKITIGIAHDYKIFRDGLKLCFSTDMKLDDILEGNLMEE
jgi:hypothetical protein